MEFKEVVIVILALVFLYVSSLSLVESHERSHEEINRIFGCDSDVSVSFFSGSTKAKNCVLSLDDARDLRMLHAQNEMTYVFITASRIVIFLLTLIFIKLSLGKKRGMNENGE